MNFEPSAKTKDLQQRLQKFMDAHVYPNEQRFEEETAREPWKPTRILEELKVKARSEGLWNLFLPEDPGGAGLSNLEYAPLCEIMGRSHMAAGIVRDGNEYIINGRKWWSSGAGDPRCKIAIFMGKSNPAAAAHRQQSMILVPLDTPGVKIVRLLKVFGYDHAPHGHGEITFENVRVPASNMLLGEGRGFEIAQGRLGPGRIHHCMRCIGVAERALETMCKRVQGRVAFGKTIAEQGTIRADIAASRMEIEQARLLTLKAAYMMDTVGNKAAKSEIAMIKVVAPNIALRIVDRAIQAHGAAGVCQDTFLAAAWAGLRTLRLADGPDEVHRESIAKLELSKYKTASPQAKHEEPVLTAAK